MPYQRRPYPMMPFPEPADMTRSLANLMQMAAAGQNFEANEMELQEAKRQHESRARIEGALKASQGNLAQAMTSLSEKGFWAEAAALRENQQKIAAEGFKTRAEQNKAGIAGLEYLTRLVQPIETLEDPAQVSQAYAEVYPQLGQALGEYAEQIQLPTPDASPDDIRAFAKRAIDRGLSAADIARKRTEALEAASRGLTDAKTQADLDKALAESLATYAPTVDTPEEWAEMRMGIESAGGSKRLLSMIGEYSPEKAKTLSSVLRPDKTPPAVASFEDYVVRTYGPNPTPAQIITARKEYQQADDRPSVRVMVGQTGPTTAVLYKPPSEEEGRQFIEGGTMTNKALWENAVSALLTGKNPYNSRSADPRMRTNFAAIDNTAAGMVRDGSSLPALQAAYKGLAAAEQQAVKNHISTKAFVDSALLGMEQAEALSAQYPRFTAPKANEMKRWLDRNIKGDPKLSEFEVFVFNTARDYAKATSGSAASIQQMTDAQIEASERLLNSTQNPEQFRAALTSMKKDMANVLTTQRRAIGTAGASILGLSDQVFGAPELGSAGFIRTPKDGDSTAPQPAGPSTTPSGTPPPTSAGSISVTAPNGRTYVFPTQAAADAFKKAAGIR